MKTNRSSSAENTLPVQAARCVKRLKKALNHCWRGFGAGTPAGAPAGKGTRTIWRPNPPGIAEFAQKACSKSVRAEE